MESIANSINRYGVVAVALHWLMAIVLIALVALGLYMVTLPDTGFETTKINLILFHKELGILALLLAALRLAWRVTNALPRLVHTLPDWQKFVARFVHLGFYALMFALPLSGWLMSSAAGFTVSFLEWFNLPDLVQRDDSLFRAFVTLHRWLAYALMFLFVVHAGAALRHHFLLRDDTLRKMLPADSVPTSINSTLPGRSRQFPATPSP